MSKVTWSQIETAVAKLEKEISPTDNLKTWTWSPEPFGIETRRSVRLPQGYALEELLNCNPSDLRQLGLRENIKTVPCGTNIYHFENPNP